MRQLLLIEDDTRLAAMLEQYLQRDSYRVTHVARASEGLNQLQVLSPSLVILDLMLPDMDGLEVCRRIRSLPQSLGDTPILMLTAKGDPMDRILGLEMGADDYLPKPFEPRELLARIKAVLRRKSVLLKQTSDHDSGTVLRFGALEIDPAARSVRLRGLSCSLTSYQFDLLLVLAERSGRVLTREKMMELVRGRELEAFDRSIDVHIGRIRNAVEDDPKDPKRILTARGVGYVFTKPQD